MLGADLSPTAAAIQVFDSIGYDAASVADIAELSGISRSTFFRRFGSKEEVVFADHEALLADLQRRLDGTTEDVLEAVIDAATTVYTHHLILGEVSKARFRLIRGVPALRDREVLTARRYETLFAQHLVAKHALADADLGAACAAAVVAVHNAALRSWLSGEEAATSTEVRRRLRRVARRFAPRAEPSGRVVVVGVETAEPLDALTERVRKALE